MNISQPFKTRPADGRMAIDVKGKQQVTHPIILYVLLLCSGCSLVSIAYDYADWILLWKIDNYFNVTPQQEVFLEQQVVELHHWHRTSELPLYVEFLSQIQKNIQSGLSPEILEDLFKDYQDLRFRLVQKLAFHGAPFLINLNPEQQRFFQAVLHEENQNLREDLGNTPEERLHNRMEKVMDLLEFWLGEVTPEQEPVIRQWIKNFPDTTEDYLAYREYRQRQFLHILQGRTDSRQVEQAVAEWIISPGRDIPQEIYAGIQKWQHAVKGVILNVDQIVTSSQRQFMVNKLQTIKNTLGTLTHT